MFAHAPQLQIIQLVECPAPPPCCPDPDPRRPPSYAPSSSAASSSYASSSSSAYESSSEPPADDDPRDPAAQSSFCSSASGPASLQPSEDRSIDDTYRVRMRRIARWLKDAAPDAAPADTAPHPRARPRSPSPSSSRAPSAPPYPAHSHSHSQKRKASDATQTPPRKYARSALSCPACDAAFSSPRGLRQHARASASVNDACRVAVEYGLEA